jgi:hypothetical protein
MSAINFFKQIWTPNPPYVIFRIIVLIILFMASINFNLDHLLIVIIVAVTVEFVYLIINRFIIENKIKEIDRRKNQKEDNLS